MVLSTRTQVTGSRFVCKHDKCGAGAVCRREFLHAGAARLKSGSLGECVTIWQLEHRRE